jgi:hypothetical protein
MKFLQKLKPKNVYLKFILFLPIEQMKSFLTH